MAYKITGQCISCNICLSACPIGAVKMIDGRPWIDPNLCTNCVDTVYTVAQCKAGCPTCNGCVKQPTDYWEGWFATYNKLVANLTNKQDYWERWFNCYSQKSPLSNTPLSHLPKGVLRSQQLEPQSNGKDPLPTVI